MAYPTPAIYIAFTDGPYVESPTWTDVTSYVRSVAIRRGKSSEQETFGTGTASVVLDNRDNRFNPFNTSGTYYGNLLPRRQIKIETTVSGTTYAVFRGFVSGWPVEYTDSGYDSTVALDCYDLLGLMSDQALPQDWSYKTIVAAGANAFWRFNDPANATTIAAAIDQTYGYSYGAAMTQTYGSTTFTKYDTLAAGIPAQSTHIGAGANAYSTGNIYRSGAAGWTIGFNNTGNISCAFWFAPDTPNTLTGYSVRAKGKNGYLEFQKQANGSLRVRYLLAASYYEAFSTTYPINGFGAHHIAATFNGTTIAIYIDGVSCAGSTTNTASATTIDAGQWVEVTNDYFQDLCVYTPNSGTGVWSASQIQDIYRAGLGSLPETTAARFTRYMQTTSVASGLYSATSAPEGTVADLDADTAIVNGLQRLAASEGGDIYVSKAGVLTQTYRSYATSQAAKTTSATFADNGSNLTYEGSLSIYADSDSSQNDITISFSADGVIRGTNQTAITATGTKSGSYDTALSTVDQAQALLNYRTNIDATIVPKISPLTVSTNTSDSAWATILGLELLNKFTLTRTPSTGSAFTTNLLVQAIEHEIVPGQWISRLTGTARYNNWFTLDASALNGPDLLLG